MIFVWPKIEKMTLAYNETEIFYEVHGDGPAMVLIHGFLEDSEIWKDHLPKLSEHNRVVALDLPGHGLSGHRSEISSMEYMSACVDHLLEHLQISSAHFVGHSMGGYVSLAAAEAFPDKVARLTLVNSAPVADNAERKLNRDRALNLLSRKPQAYIKATLTSLFSPESQLQYSDVIDRLIQRALKFPVEGIAAAIRGMRDRPDRCQVLSDFQRPKQIICGKSDPIIPFELIKSIAEKTNTQLKVLSGGHMSWVESSIQLTALL